MRSRVRSASGSRSASSSGDRRAACGPSDPPERSRMRSHNAAAHRIERAAKCCGSSRLLKGNRGFVKIPDATAYRRSPGWPAVKSCLPWAQRASRIAPHQTSMGTSEGTDSSVGVLSRRILLGTTFKGLGSLGKTRTLFILSLRHPVAHRGPCHICHTRQRRPTPPKINTLSKEQQWTRKVPGSPAFLLQSPGKPIPIRR
jgi:hypothetical protein